MNELKLFLVEDDIALQKAMMYNLKKEGFEVISARSVEESRKILKNNKFDFILLDIMLPDGSGYDICEEIRKSSDVPVIFMTACEDEANVVLGLDIGGDDYITKPVRIRELMSRIKAVLRRRGVQEEDVIKSGELEVDLLRYKVSRKGVEVNLTAMEYKLLLMFLRNKGQVLERDLILQKLWDLEGDFIDGNTLSVYIKRLRDKLEENDIQYIQTIRGIGYKWIR